MAKELPYFKFEPNQWENGNIQICSREDKGLFLDLCSMYWSRLGNLPLKLAIQKLCAGNATAFDSLMREEIFEVIEGLICIKFLNEQLQEFNDTSEQNSKNAREGWEKRRKIKDLSEPNATALNPQSETYAIREDKSKENEIKENNSKALPFKFFDSLISLGAEKQLVSDWIAVRKLKKLSNTITAFENFNNEVLKSGKSINEVLKECVINSWGGFKSEWLQSNKMQAQKKYISPTSPNRPVS